MKISSTSEFLRSDVTRDMTPEYGSGRGACRRHEPVERSSELPSADRHAGFRELADEARALVRGEVEEPLEVAHRAGGEVVEDEERLLHGPALLERDRQPPLRVLPVAGD